MSDKDTNDESAQLRARVAALEQLLEVHERTVAEQSHRLERALVQHREHALRLSQSEQDLLKQTTILQSILDNMADGVVVADERGKLLIFNPAAERIIGLSVADSAPEEWSRRFGLYLPDMISPFPTAELPLLRAVRGEEVNELEVFVRHERVPDGIWLSVTARPLRDNAGKLKGGVAVFRDVTERKRVEQRVATQQATTRVLAESPTLDAATPLILQSICESLGWEMGAIWRVDASVDVLRCVATWHRGGGGDFAEFEEITRTRTFSRGVGLPGRVWSSGQPAWIEDVTTDGNFPRAPFAARVGLHGAFGFPIDLAGEVLGVIEFFSRQIRRPDDDLLRMIAAIGSQIGQFIERRRAEDTLKHERFLLHSLLENVPDAIYFKDADCRFTRINRSLAKKNGLADPSEAIGKSDFDFFTEEHARPAFEDEQEVMRTGQPLIGKEEKEVWPDGRVTWVLTTKLPLRDAAGTIVGTFGISRDITNRKEAEIRLRDSEALYHSLVESLPLNVCRKDIEGRVTFVNSMYLKTLGKSRDEIIGKTDHDLFPKELADKYVEDDARVRERGGVFETIEEHQKPSGERLFVQVLKTPVFDAAGATVGTQFFFWDVTERHRAEEALHNSERRYRQFTQGSQDAIVVADQSGRITLFNVAAQKTFGYTEAEVLGEPVTKLMPREFQEAHTLGFARYLATREPRAVGHTIELRGRRKNGEIFHLDLSLTALDLPEGISFLAAIRDTSERHRNAEERARMQARIALSERMASLGLLSAGVAHEINNPLAFIGNNLAVLDRDFRGLGTLLDAYDAAGDAIRSVCPDLSRRIAEIAEAIDLPYIRGNLQRILDSTRQGTKRVADIVHNLHKYARPNQIGPDRVDIHDVIATSLEMIQGRLDRRNISVARNFAELPPIWCAPAQLHQVFLNVFVNAMQAIEATRKQAGTIEITTRAKDEQVVVEIADDGCGIAPDDLPRIFHPFFTTKPVGDGTGLGLSISHGIVRDHNGEIEVESAPGQGTRFRVILPVQSEERLRGG